MMYDCDVTTPNLSVLTISDQICQRGLIATCTVSRCSFHRHLTATSMDQQDMCVILSKAEQSAFTPASSSACLMSTSGLVAFKWPHYPLTSRQPTVIHHKTG